MFATHVSAEIEFVLKQGTHYPCSWAVFKAVNTASFWTPVFSDKEDNYVIVVVSLSVCLSVSNFAQELRNGFA